MHVICTSMYMHFSMNFLCYVGPTKKLTMSYIEMYMLEGFLQKKNVHQEEDRCTFLDENFKARIRTDKHRSMF